MTVPEMLTVLAILGIVLASLSTLFLSALNSQTDQSNRHQAQQEARLALDALRRELRCASQVTATLGTPPPSPQRSLTATLPGYCRKPPAAASVDVTWCVRGTSAPFALWRYQGTSCSGTGVRKAQFLVSNSIFTYNMARLPSDPRPTLNAPAPGPNVTNGFFRPGTYSYMVTAVTSTGEILSPVQRVTITAGSPNQMNLSWSPFAGATAYNVYGRDDGTYTTHGLRKLHTTTLLSWVDLGCSTPAPDCDPAVKVDSSLPAPPLARIGFELILDVTTVDSRQRFVLQDDVVLRNSGRY